MKHFLKYTTLAISLLTSLSLYADTAQNTNNAAPNQATVNLQTLLQKQGVSNQDATNSLIKWLNANLVTGTPIDFAKSMKGNLQTILANHDINNLNWQITRAITFVALKGQAPTTDNKQAQNNSAVRNDSQNTEADDIAKLNTVSQSDLVPNTTDKPDYVKQKLSQFNIGKLLSTRSMEAKSEDNKNAQILMQFVSGLADSVGPLSQKDIAQNSGPINDFQQEYGVYLAQQSLGLNVLYSLITERLVQKGLGSQLGGPQKDMSPLALDQYMATRRLNVNDPKGWLSQLANASPAQVAKEQLMLMAEMRYEMYQTRMVLVNIEQLMAVQELQSNDAKKNTLLKLQADVSSSALPSAINQ